MLAASPATAASPSPDANANADAHSQANGDSNGTAAGKTKKYLQFNIAGNSKHHGDPAVAQTVISRIRDEQPYVVTLNEVCTGQYAAIAKGPVGRGLSRNARSHGCVVR